VRHKTFTFYMTNLLMTICTKCYHSRSGFVDCISKTFWCVFRFTVYIIKRPKSCSCADSICRTHQYYRRHWLPNIECSNSRVDGYGWKYFKKRKVLRRGWQIPWEMSTICPGSERGDKSSMPKKTVRDLETGANWWLEENDKC